jgi:superfamily II DNA or RNA helicase
VSQILEIDWADDAPAPLLRLRPYQTECIESVEAGWAEATRQLVVMSGGCGKTVVFANIARDEVAKGGKVLILAHTDELLEQAIDKLRKSTGLVADKEKADDHASPFASVVIASVQTLTRDNRLTGFADDHFSLVIVDECHRSLAKSYLKIIFYFHYGRDSLNEGWSAPEIGAEYQHKARILGVTATASRGDKRDLGELYQKIAYEYGLLEAVRDGYLVRPLVKNIPLKIDMRGVKLSRAGGQGADFDLGEVTARIAPILREVAKQIALHAKTLKTVVFTPSIETARLLSLALCDEGMNGSFVSGACDDRDEKIVAFRAAGPGTVLCNALLVVEGFDVPDITGVCILRPTKIWSFFVQASVRGTRTLPGLIDHLDDREARLAAIAASAKPHFVILDFLWLTDRIDLIQPVDLVASKPAIRKAMLESGEVDLVAAESVAERDMLKALQDAAKKHARKQARTIDPIALSVSLGDASLASYEPETSWDSLPPTDGQLSFLQKQGIDVSNIKCKGLASKVIARVISRLKHHLATPRQLSLMAQLGLDEQTCATLTVNEASAVIDKTIKAKKRIDA